MFLLLGFSFILAPLHIDFPFYNNHKMLQRVIVRYMYTMYCKHVYIQFFHGKHSQPNTNAVEVGVQCTNEYNKQIGYIGRKVESGAN